jgi:Ca2+-binding EF-hand superfamily protein
VDAEKTGRITNLAFKKAFRLLNIALTSKEIDLLLNYCEFRAETLIDWRQFIKQLALQEDKLKLRARLQPKLQHISDLLHYYMISPKDAFRKVHLVLRSGTTLDPAT